MESKTFSFPKNQSLPSWEYCFQSQNPDEWGVGGFQGSEVWWSSWRGPALTPPTVKNVRVQVHMLRLDTGSPGGTALCWAQGRVAVSRETQKGLECSGAHP